MNDRKTKNITKLIKKNICTFYEIAKDFSIIFAKYNRFIHKYTFYNILYNIQLLK